MTHRSRTPLGAALLAAGITLLPSLATAQLHWSATAGPDRDGDWDSITTTTINWDPAAGAAAGTVGWTNGPTTAVFNNIEDGAVAVTEPITASGIAAGDGGTYTITGGTITAAGPALNVNVGNADSGLLNIGSILDAPGVIKQGLGTLDFTGTTTGGMGVQGGMVVLSGNNIEDSSILDVQAGSTLQLDGSDTVGSLMIDGTLSGTGILTAGTYSLLGGAVIDGHLGEGTFDKADAGPVTISSTGTAASDTVNVNAGTLILAGDNLEDTAALAAMGGGIVQVNGTDTVGSYTQGGTGELSGVGTLTAASGAALSGGTVSGNLSGDVTTDGPVTITGTGSVGGGSLDVTAGTLTLDGTSTSTPVTIAGPGTLVVNNAGLDGGAVVINDGNLNVNNVGDTVATYESTGGTLGGNQTLTTTGGATLNNGATVNSVLLGDTQTNGTVAIAGNIDGGTLTVNSGTLNVTGKIFSTTTTVLDGTVNLNGAGGAMNGPLVLGDDIGGPATAQVISLAPGQFGGPTTDVVVNSDGKLTAFDDTISGLAVIGGTVDTGAGAAGLTVNGLVVLQGGTIEGTGPFVPAGGQVDTNTAADSSIISAPVNLGAATLFDVADGAAGDDLVISGQVSGGTLDFVNGGTLVLSNPGNTYGGGTSINGGTLTIGATGATGVGPISVLGSTINYANGVDEVNPVNLSAAVDLNVDGGAAATQSGAINGGFAITKIGGGTLDLAGANTYTGATNVNDGILSVSGTLAAATDVVNGAEFQVNNNNTVNSYESNGGILGGSATLTTVNDVTLNDGSSVTGNLIAGGNTTTGGTVSISGSATGANLDVNGTLATISGQFEYPVININAGELAFTGPADTTTPTTVNAGATTTFSNNATNGIDFGIGGGGILVGSNTTISGDGLSLFQTVSVNTNTVVSGNLVGANVGLDNTTVSGQVGSGAITTNNNVSVTGLLGDGTFVRGGTNITVGPGGTTTVASGTLSVSGAGQLTSKFYDILDGATVEDQNAGIIDSAMVSSTGGTLNVTGTDVVDSYTSMGTVLNTADLGGGGTLEATNGAILNDKSSVSGNLSGNTQTNGVVGISGSGGGGTLMVNNGTLTITGSTDYAGGTQVKDGTLQLNGGGFNTAISSGDLTIGDGIGAPASAMAEMLAGEQISNSSNVVVNSDGKLVSVNEGINDLTVNSGLVDTGAGGGIGVLGTATLDSAAISGVSGIGFHGGLVNVLPSGASSVISSPVSFATGGTNFNVADGAAASDLLISGPISVLSGDLTKTGAGTLELSNPANGAFGDTNVNAGTLLLSGNLPSPTVGIAFGATLIDQSGGIGDTADLTNAGTLQVDADDTINSYTSNAGTLQGPSKLTAATYDLNNGSVVSGNLGMGTLNANGTVTYSGTSMADTVNIQSGTTSLTGAGQFGRDSSTFDISGGARLELGGADYRFETVQGTGTAAGNLMIGPGDSLFPATDGTVGTFNVDGSPTVQGGAGNPGTVGIDVMGSLPGQFDVVNVSGTLTLGPDSSLVVNNPGGAPLANPIDIIDFAAQAGNFTETNLGLAFPGVLATYDPNTGILNTGGGGGLGGKSGYRYENLTENQSFGFYSLWDDVIDPAFQNVVTVPSADGTSFQINIAAPGTNFIASGGDALLREALQAVLAGDPQGNPMNGAVMNLLLPEVHQGMGDFTEQSMRGLVRLATRTAPVAKAGSTKVFAAVHSSNGGASKSQNNADYDVKMNGAVTGVRYEAMPGLQFGALLGYDDGSIEGALVDTDGNGLVFGLFGEYVINPDTGFTVFSSISYGDYEYDATRTSYGMGGVPARVSANGVGADALEFAIGVQGVAWENENFRLIPMAALRYLTGEVDGFTETGPGVALMVDGYDIDSVLLEIGVDAELDVNEVVTLGAHFGFVTDFEDSGNSVGARYTAGSRPFSVMAPGIDDEAFVFGVGATFDVNEALQIGVNWRSEFRKNSQSVNSFSVGGSYGF